MIENWKQAGRPVLLVDSGNVLFKNRDTLQLPQQDLLSARAILDIYSVLGYDAMAVGPHDLAGGLDLLIESRNDGTPWVSANLVDNHGEPVFSPWIIREKDGSRIGILGLTGNTATQEHYSIRPWEEVLPQYLDALFPACDFIIVLSNLDEAANATIAKDYPQIQLIVSANRKAGNIVPRLHNNTVFTQSHVQGKYLGILSVSWPNHGIWRDTAPAAVSALIDELEKKVSTEEPVRQKASELMQLLGPAQAPEEITKGGSYTYRFMSLSEQIKDTEWVKERIARLKSDIAAANRAVRIQAADETTSAASAPSRTSPDAFAGADSCRQCHRAQYRQWSETAHASSMASLVRQQQQFNLSCLACHVTRDMTGESVNQPGLDLLRLPDSLKAVGCESCHGAGKAHIDSGGEKGMLRPVTEATCTQCHTAEMDTNFNYRQRLVQIGCPS